ncbi:monovalent cation/H+ antiporter complex subunit F [Trujillonella humicola]|uniref:monovalent cation/H+ antiporter complex subunit F n=1 Tax=Trujillonella humicola TaxID=3383699 RepID=UPI003905D8CD
MVAALLSVAVLVLLAALLAVVRVLRGPTRADRIVGVYFTSIGGTALLAVLGDLADDRAYRDAALVLVLLSSVLAAAFAARERAPGTPVAGAGPERSEGSP